MVVEARLMRARMKRYQLRSARRLEAFLGGLASRVPAMTEAGARRLQGRQVRHRRALSSRNQGAHRGMFAGLRRRFRRRRD